MYYSWLQGVKQRLHAPHLSGCMGNSVKTMDLSVCEMHEPDFVRCQLSRADCFLTCLMSVTGVRALHEKHPCQTSHPALA